MATDLTTTNVLLGIMAAVSLLEAVAVLGVFVAGAVPVSSPDAGHPRDRRTASGARRQSRERDSGRRQRRDGDREERSGARRPPDTSASDAVGRLLHRIFEHTFIRRARHLVALYLVALFMSGVGATRRRT